MTESLPAIFYQLHTRFRLPHPYIDYPRNYSENLDGFRQLIQALPAFHLCQLMEAREWLRASTNFLFDHVLPSQVYHRTDCARSNVGAPDNCSDRWYNHVSSCNALDDTGTLFLDPLRVLTDMDSDVRTWSDDRLCLTCKSHGLRALDATRRFIWDELPFHFRLKIREEGEQCRINEYM